MNLHLHFIINMQIQIKASAEQKAILFLKNIDASIKILWFENEIVDAFKLEQFHRD